MPHRFFKTDYGDGLRSLLSSRKNLVEIVDFDGFMVFPEASINTCIIVLGESVNSQFKFSQTKTTQHVSEEMSHLLTKIAATTAVDDSDIQVGEISITHLTGAPWIFILPKEEQLWKKFRAHSETLGSISTQIFQGLKTGGDAIFAVELLSRKKNFSRIHCLHDDEDYDIENELLMPLIKGGEMKRYFIAESKRAVIFPYVNGNLIDQKELRSRYPLAWRYFEHHREYLESRESRRMKGPNWYGYTRSQALSSMQQPKIVTPDYYAHASYALDRDGKYFFFGGGAGGYGIVVKPGWNVDFILGLLNSKALDWYLRKVSIRQYQTAFSYVRKYIEQLPIPSINHNNSEDEARHRRLISLVESMRGLHVKSAGTKSETEEAVMHRQIASIDREIDALVYELYGLTEAEIAIVEGKSK